MGPDQCEKFASRCMEFAAEATNEAVRSDLSSQARAWLQVAYELNRNDAFRKCVEGVEIPEPVVEQ